MRTLPLLMLAVACAPPDTSELFHHVDVVIEEGGEAASARLAAVADEADTELRVALEGLDDADLTDAILAAFDRGVDVRVAVDIDRELDDGVQALLDAGVDVTLADDGMAYFDFGTNNDVAWTSEQTTLTHAFAVADTTRWAMATGAGDTLGGNRIVFDGIGEDVGEDLVLEHIQIFGGTDATATTAFDAMAKSVVDDRWVYQTTSDEHLELWFNPQQRGVKRIIDAVYRARSSVRIVTEDFADEGLALALQKKAEDGFDVEVIVGSTFGSTSSALSDVLRNKAPDVPLYQATTPAPLPTIAFVDYDRARDGRYHEPMAMMLTHPLISAARLYAGVEVVNDQMVDGALYVYKAQGRPTDTLQALADLYGETRAISEDLR